MRRRSLAAILIALPLVLAVAGTAGANVTAQGYKGKIVSKLDGAPIPGAESFTCDSRGCSNGAPANDLGRYKNLTDATTFQPVFAEGGGFFVPATYGPNGSSIPGFDYAKGAPVVVNPGEMTPRVNFKLPIGGGISVHVQQGSGDPVSGVFVSPQWNADGHQSGFAARTDMNGDVELDGVMTGKNYLSVFDTSGIWASAKSGTIVVYAQTVTPTVVITLSYKGAAAAPTSSPPVVVRTAIGAAIAG
jgi:hypothetical protein